MLLSEDVKKKHGINESDISYALTLPDLDEAYTRRIHNFQTTNDLYQWSSSLNYLAKIRKPMVFINSKDDPLVPEILLEPIKEHASKSNKHGSIEIQLLTYFRNFRKTPKHIVRGIAAWRSFRFLRRWPNLSKPNYMVRSGYYINHWRNRIVI